MLNIHRWSLCTFQVKIIYFNWQLFLFVELLSFNDRDNLLKFIKNSFLNFNIQLKVYMLYIVWTFHLFILGQEFILKCSSRIKIIIDKNITVEKRKDSVTTNTLLYLGTQKLGCVVSYFGYIFCCLQVWQKSSCAHRHSWASSA